MVNWQLLQGMLEGGKIEGNPIICDVRDVAYAHITAAESPSATGRSVHFLPFNL